MRLQFWLMATTSPVRVSDCALTPGISSRGWANLCWLQPANDNSIAAATVKLNITRFITSPPTSFSLFIHVS